MSSELPALPELEGASAAEILRWAAKQYAPKITFGTGFGVEGCVLIDLIARESLPIDLFTLDTGVLFPETYELWRKLERRYGVKIRAVRGPSLEEQAAQHGDKLWERDPDKCCEIRKVFPQREALKGFSAWVSAIRRDQTQQRAGARPVERDAKFGLIKVNPLIAWTTKDVWDHVFKHQVPYNPLHDQGYPSIGCLPCTSPVAAGEDPRAGRWRGLGKKECGLHYTKDTPK
jgi:phosphoadenosine phosphosulfate reductase